MQRRALIIATGLSLTAAPAFAAILFSVRSGGPSGFAGDLFLIAPGPSLLGGPSVAGGGAGSGMGLIGDEIDGASRRGSYSTFLVSFGVDDDSVGDQPPVGTDGGGVPFNFFVADQAIKNQQAGDTYLTTEAFTTAGKVPPPTSIGDDFHVLERNQSEPFVADFGLLPAVGPEQFVPRGENIDDVDDATCIEDPRNLPPIYFSVSSTSPSAANLPGPPSGATIYIDPDINTGGDEQLFAQPNQLGLSPFDDVDALVVSDATPGDLFNPMTDFIAFSLAPGSPTLALTKLSAADVLIVDAMGLRVLALHSEIGLQQSDNINSLSFVPLVGGSAAATLEAAFSGVPLPCPPVSAVPIPLASPVGLAVLAGGLAAGGLWIMRRVSAAGAPAA